MTGTLVERIWGHLPKTVSTKHRIQAAVLWGLVLPFAFGGVYALRHRGEPEPWSLFLTLIPWFAVLGVLLLIPRVGEKVYLGVLGFFSIFGFIIGTTLLSLMFFFVITPLGWVLRRTGRNSIDMKFRNGAGPAWHEHHGKKDLRRYYRLF
jgi:hypothetical protein